MTALGRGRCVVARRGRGVCEGGCWREDGSDWGRESWRLWGCLAAARVRVECRCTMVDAVSVGRRRRGIVGRVPNSTGFASEGLIGQLSRGLPCKVSGILRVSGYGGGAEEWLGVGRCLASEDRPGRLAAR